MKLFLTTVLFLILIITKMEGQTIKNYDTDWKKVDELLKKKGLIKSALEELKKIYVKAKAEKQEAQVIKALVYQVNLQKNITEHGEEEAIKEIEKEITLQKEPVAIALLKSLLADMYWQYFQNHRWNLYDRTKTELFVKDDIATWSLIDFHKRISDLYLQSINSEKVLKNTKLSNYDALIIKGNVRTLRPTLYDLLAHNALEYFKNDERDMDKPAYTFEIDQPKAFAPAAAFVSATFITKDSLSLKHKALLIYQDLIRFHLTDASPEALIDVDIDRIEYVYNNAVMPNKDSLYQQSLETLISKYNNASIAQARYLLAAYYESLAVTYHPLRDTTYRFARLKAKEILEKVVQDSALKNEGWTNSYNLLHQINKQDFSFKVEKVSLPDQPFRALVNYKNITSLYLRIIKLDAPLKEALQMRNDTYWTKLTNAAAVNKWMQILPQTGDLQHHAVEIKVDGLPIGEYILLASANEKFDKKDNPLGAQLFYVSNISYVTQDNQFFVLHRQSGQPLPNAKVDVYQQQYDYKAYKYTSVPVGSFKTDKNGYLKFDPKKEERRNNYLLDITYNKDRLKTEDVIYNYYYTNEEQITTQKKTFFFTDRSIYRPGQTVYFKAITINKNGKSSKVAKGYKATFYLSDANNEEIDSLELTTNEFGSVWGKFVLPANTLNGAISIHDKEERNLVSFSVEEYKRPKFYTAFEKVKGTYKVGDSITITGNAKAYAGNTIVGAKVSYRVVREPRFLYPWIFWRWMPTTAPMEIAHGETHTDENGLFKIAFKAIPDVSIAREMEPVFDYRIYADVTDINGETRSTEEIVSAGYKSLILKTGIAERIVADSLKALSIRTENMSGTFEQAVVTVAFYLLQPEQRLIRERYWEQPDQFVLSKEEFIKHFPHDEYAAERDSKSWNRV
ncbi:MAG TPA: MG2 domain-containing protein, partial [Chitinophagaceae bacterium]|nr:MG2 domain-containing protein [Chitinophagaceae bacterium]